MLWLIVAMFGLGMSSLLSKPLYDHLPILTQMQFPWRFLLTMHFASAILVALVITAYKLHSNYVYLFIAAVIIMRLPEVYGKNFVSVPATDYSFNIENLHTVSMNPQWVGDSQDYPIMTTLFSIIEGSGQLISSSEKPSSRRYQYDSQTASRISFNTFYFPNWQLQINGKSAVTEYQDPNYRGVMTTRLEPGMHDISLIYKDTVVRKISKLMSVLAISFSVIYVWLYAKQNHST
jgi:hypothetical protein